MDLLKFVPENQSTKSHENLSFRDPFVPNPVKMAFLSLTPSKPTQLTRMQKQKVKAIASFKQKYDLSSPKKNHTISIALKKTVHYR